MNTINRPLLRYHGGKFLLADWIISHFPKHRIYVEPFGGAASVLLKKKPASVECYNDINEEVVSLFRVLQNPEKRKRLKELLEYTPYSRSEWELSIIPCSDMVEQARRTIIRSWQSHGTTQSTSGFRTNFRAAGIDICAQWNNWKKGIDYFCERLSNVIIENNPAQKVMIGFDTPETLFYLDPPYVSSTRGKWKNKGYEHEMTDSDHEEIIEAAQNLKGMVVLSGYRCELLDDMLCSWKRYDLKTYSDKALNRTESVWVNDNVMKQEKQLSLFR